MAHRPVQPTDRALAQAVGADILLGSAFAFVGRAALQNPALAWVTTLAGDAAAGRPRIVSLLGRAPVALPGGTVTPAALPPLSLASVTSDKALYREGRDDVHLLAIDPLAASPDGADAVLEIKANGADHAAHPVRLDPRGVAAVTLRDLPAGAYEVRLRGAPKDAAACPFTVAAYRLAPLVASLSNRSLDGATLRVTIRLESFGAPVDGAVLLDLMDRDRRLAQVRAEARAGVAEAAFKLSGEGPHSVNAQLVADPSRTATIPIVGSRAAERSRTTLSTLGTEVTASLLPGEDSRAVRGLYLEEGGMRTTPFRLERVDARRARLTTVAPVEAARVVLIDPSIPSARAGAVDPSAAPHPAHTDVRYRQAEEIFQQKRFAAARRGFEEARATIIAPHPNYSYYIACCHALEGDRDRAVAALRDALRDGWTDMGLLATDEDLASLRGHEGYEALKRGGRREIALEGLAAGAPVEVDVPGPIALIAIGAYVNGSPWEGWAALLTPSAIEPRIEIPERCAPGDDVRITIDTGRAAEDVAVYVVVKDARLLTPDTPASRLAAGLKAFAEGASKELAVGKPDTTLAAAIPPPPPSFDMAVAGGFGPPPVPRSPMPVSARARSMPGGFPPPAPAAMGPPPPAPAFGPPMAMAGPAPGGFAPTDEPMSYAGIAEGAGAAVDRLEAPPRTGAPPAPGAPGPYRQAAPPPPPSVEEPEVLYAGLVAAERGRASLSVRVGPDFADYLVEAFVLAGGDWAPVEARFRAEKDLFASLDVPAFVHPADAAIARVHVGSRAGARLRLTRDGEAVPLLFNGRPLAPGDALPAGRAEVTFLAGPGEYECQAEDLTGDVDRVSRRVDVPGKLRRVARSVRFLEPGQRVSRDEDPSILGLKVLPGLEKPFRALTDATADYGHACCEQTAAKLLAACSMYAFADKDRSRRERAESIILAGVRREASMWLRGKGFRMYPESAASPDRYWGPLAARHLWNLSLLRDLDGPAAPGPALSRAIAEGLDMAADATSAYGFKWPPAPTSGAGEAYQAIRFGGDAAGALHFIRQRTAGLAEGALPGVPPSPCYTGGVAMRADAAYYAAGLFRGGAPADRGRALGLANAVVRQLGDNGRLYSTVDSVAAMALRAELRAARIVSGAGAGAVELDGERMSIAVAVARPAPARTIAAVEGTVAVEVTRSVEEDWSAFDAALPLYVALEKNGGPVRRLRALDSVDLKVKLENGYKGGDLLWVCLPDALSRVEGGGQVTRFAVDFRGKDEVKIPLAATNITVGPNGEAAPARFAVCVRNMFEEERGGNPGWLEVTVSPPDDSGSVLGRALGALRGLFGK
ncbi:MAG: hypothetical protein IT372_06480 [Polyangiaceae bacterium]|nr:hypothetical protein [Polyangiaceae bacterium]